MALPKLPIGRDLGDRFTQLCALDAGGQIRATARVRTTPAALERHGAGHPRARIVLEVGPPSPWVSRRLARLGPEVLVANARQLRLIYGSDRQSDRVDAESLARLGRLDPALLKPIHHRGPEAQADLAQRRARDARVRTRTLLIHQVRGAVKAWGARLPASSAPAFATAAAAGVPRELRGALDPLLALIARLTQEIRGLERQLERLAPEPSPEPARLRQPSGGGLLTALWYVLTREDPGRFHQSRAVGPYLGLCPRRDQSGGRDAQLRITQRGAAMLRRRLGSGAPSILGPLGPDTDLRRGGLRLAARGGRNAKKRAVVAVARKLATLLHRRWVSGATDPPLRAAA